MVHIAYDVKELLKSFPVKIESVAVWGSRLLISCIDGSLRVYKTENPTEDHLLQDDSNSRQHSPGPIIHKTDTFSLDKTLIGFSKKPISSMTVVPSRNLLITLSDAIVVHKLPGLEAVAYLSSSKGSSLYAWDEKSGLLCSVKQRRLIIFQYDGRQGFVESKELTAPDNVTSVAWFGDSLCLGIRREYIIINTNTSVVVDLFPCGQIAPPSVISLPNGELLLGKDNVSVIVGQNAKLSHSGGLSWSEVPGGVLANPPYALAWLSRSIEVRYLQPPFSLVQMIPLREMQLLPKGNHVIAAGEHVLISSDHSIYALLMVPLGAQIVQLAASRSFDEALMLCKLLPPEDAALRANKEDDIHKRYGQFLFEQKDYAKSMEQFAMSSIDLLAVLSLFPSIQLPSFCADDVDGKRLQLPSLENETPDPYEDVYAEWEGEGYINKELQVEKDKVAAMSALSSFLMGKRNVIVAKADAEETNATVAEMVNSAASAGESTKSSRSLAKPNNTSAGTDHERVYTPKELATILDTALLQAQLFSKQFVAANELLSGLNYCDVPSCEDMMIQGSHYKELLQLYKYNELHRKVLDLLNKLAIETENVDNTEVASYQAGPDEIIKYFKKLGGQDPFLILDSAIWLLKSCPEQAIHAFISMDPPLPTDIVNKHLKEKFPELQIMYLEQLMMNTDKVKFKANLQNELVDLYLQKVLEERNKMLEDGSWDEHMSSDTRKKLLNVLENCTDYSCENALMRLPANGLHEERAILLGKLGQHQLALTLYAQKLHEPELALKYCDKVFQANAANKMSTNNSYDKSALNIYLILLQVYLKPTSAIREYDRSVASLDFSRKFPSQRRGSAPKPKGHVARKIAQIEGWDDGRQSISSESTAESGKSDGEENLQANEGAVLERLNQETEKVMLDEALDLLSCRWDRIDVGHALSLLPGDTKLQRLYPFLEPLVRKSSEARRNLSVIKNLRQSEHLQVKEDLQKCRRHVVKISNENTCSICRKKIGASVFAVYPDQTLVHFVCFKDQRMNGGAVGKSIRTH